MKKFALALLLLAGCTKKAATNSSLDGSWQSTTASCEAAVEKNQETGSVLEFARDKAVLMLKKEKCAAKIQYKATQSPNDFVLSEGKIIEDQCGLAKGTNPKISQVFNYEKSNGVLKVHSSTGSGGCRVFVKR